MSLFHTYLSGVVVKYFKEEFMKYEVCIKKILIALLLTDFSLSHSSTRILLPKDLFESVPFSSEYIEDGAIIRNINYKSINEVLIKLNELEKVKLESRGEAHITVITPPEAKGWFNDHKGINYLISPIELHHKYFKSLQKTKFEPICIGKQENKKGHKVFYIVVKSEDLFRVRREIHKELLMRSKFTDKKVFFKPENFYPHITIGYIGGDIHGVSKGVDTCVYYFSK